MRFTQGKLREGSVASGSEILRCAQDDSPLHLTVDQSGAIGSEILRCAQDDRAGPCWW